MSDRIIKRETGSQKDCLEFVCFEKFLGNLQSSPEKTSTVSRGTMRGFAGYHQRNNLHYLWRFSAYKYIFTVHFLQCFGLLSLFVSDLRHVYQQQSFMLVRTEMPFQVMLEQNLCIFWAALNFITQQYEACIDLYVLYSIYPQLMQKKKMLIISSGITKLSIRINTTFLC